MDEGQAHAYILIEYDHLKDSLRHSEVKHVWGNIFCSPQGQ